MNSNFDFELLDGAKPWHVLRVPRDADADQINRGWRRMSAVAHPDHGGNQEWMTQVNIARDILTDPVRLADYLARLEPAPPAPARESKHDRSEPAAAASEPSDDSFEWTSGTGPDPNYLRQPPTPDPEPETIYVDDPFTYPYPAPDPAPYPPRPAPQYAYPKYGSSEPNWSSMPRSRLAIASLPAAIFCSPIGLVMAIIALRRISRTGQRGKAWAWAAILVTALMVFYTASR